MDDFSFLDYEYDSFTCVTFKRHSGLVPMIKNDKEYYVNDCNFDEESLVHKTQMYTLALLLK